MTSVSRPRRMGIFGAVAAGVVVLDQLTKSWAENHLASRSIHVVWTLRLQLEHNPGIAFSLGQGSTGVVTVVALAVLAVVITVAWRTEGWLLAIALGLVVGGATGNLVDRLARHNGGQVIDFIDLRWWPVFNVADMAISCGVILALLAGARTASPTSS